MKRNTITILIVLLSISILLATLFTLPRIDKAQPDPYFHVRITPIIYWIGFSLAVLVTLGIVFSKNEGSVRYGLGLFSVMLLSIYVYDIPKLFYINPIYTDTYIFVGELLATLRYGHIGWGHSYATPGLALFSSQFSLITGIDHIIVAQIVLLIIPLITIFFIYVIAQLFFDKRVALLACLFCISINWMGFAFNRQSFAFVLYMFVCFSIFRIFLRKSVSLSWYVMVVLSYVALVISHPVSSLLMIITLSATVFFACLMFLVRRVFRTSETFLAWRNLAIKLMLLIVFFSIIWLSWNVYTGVNLDYALRTLDETTRGLFGLGRREQWGGIVTSYTNVYIPIVRLRQLEIVFEAAIGTILTILALIKIKSYLKKIILPLWFISCMSISIFGFYGNWLQLLYRPVLHAFPAFSILLARFIISKNRAHTGSRYEMKMAFKIFKVVAMSAMLFFLICIPLTMYSHAPFIYPPTVYLRQTDHVVQHGNGTIAVFERGSEFGYYQLLRDAYHTSLVSYNFSNHYEYKTIITGHRAQAKDGFFVYTPPLTYIMEILETKSVECPTFAKVYDSDSWHRVYVNQTVDSARP